MTWNAVSGYVPPLAETQTLAAGGSLTFSGTYIEEVTTGTIIIDQTPDSLIGAVWALFGPQHQSGSGDMTLTDMQMGDYTLNWNNVSEYIRPIDETLTLMADSTVTFRGSYYETSGPSVGFVEIPAGTFTMGSPEDENSHESNETQHTVILTTSFAMFSTEVTNQQYADLAQWANYCGYCTVVGSTVRDAIGGSTEELLDLEYYSEIVFSDAMFAVEEGMEDHPVRFLSWYGAAAYCDWLSLRAGLTRAYGRGSWECNYDAPYNAEGYRLPTEAEWEYACRAGTMTPFYTGDCLDAGTEANYEGIYPYADCPSGLNIGATVPVGSYPANDFGLYDMHGNVYEWCTDGYEEYGDDETDPVGPGYWDDRVFRGGCWRYPANRCRSADRSFVPLGFNHSVIGIRPTRSLK
jgi:formylglycine-generating enzyme required for sulfatase activity